MTTSFVTDRSSFREGAGEGQEVLALPSVGVANSPPPRYVASVHLPLNPFRLVVFWLPLDLGELCHISEMEAFIIYKMIVRAFEGLCFCRTLGWSGGQSCSWLLRPCTTL